MIIMIFPNQVVFRSRLFSWLPISYVQRNQSEITNTRKHEFAQIFPPKLFQKRHRTPDTFYLADQNAAKTIADTIRSQISNHETLLEFNPGIGLMSEQFASWKSFKRIIFIEQNQNAKHILKRICNENDQDFLFKSGDFVNIWKLVFQDKVDNGSRFSNLLEDVPKIPFGDGTNMTVFGCTGSSIFFKHLINSIVFQTSLYSLGRCELFVLMPPPIYVINSIDPEYLYLVKIVPRRNLFDLCPVEDIQALWYFIRQNNVSRRNRIIPNLEKYVPGCGPRLIINSTQATQLSPVFPKDLNAVLPKYSTPCVEMSNNCCLPHLDIYTSFGDLTPSQMLTLFCQFRKWPEYKDSSFLASLENSLLKLESTADEAEDSLDVVEDEGSSTQ